jgi:hypothetical protein
MREVIDASPAIRVNDSRLSSQKRDGPPKPCSLIIDSAKSKPYFSARNTISLLRSKLGVYCGDVVEISQPLFPIGMKTPISIMHLNVTVTRCDAATPMPSMQSGRSSHCDATKPLALRIKLLSKRVP